MASFAPHLSRARSGHVGVVLRSAGSSLPARVQAAAQARFGTDFSSVRIHTDPTAAASAQTLGAEAYAVADRIVFDHGRFDPVSSDGQTLLHHELAHVAQWRAGGSRRPRGAVRISDPADAAEAEADRHDRHRAGPVSPVAEPVLQRKLKKPSGKVSMGKYDIDIVESTRSPGKAEVTIQFTPDPKSPQTDHITFMQMAKPPMTIDEWVKMRPEDKDLKKYTTAGGAHMDVDPSSLKPRAKASDPLVWPDYPHIRMQTEQGPKTTDSLGPTHSTWVTFREGSNNPGKQRSAIMEDIPGGGWKQGTFSFETTAYAKDRGLAYGTVFWEFRYNGPGSKPAISNEKAEVKETISPEFADAYLRFAKHYNP